MFFDRLQIACLAVGLVGLSMVTPAIAQTLPLKRVMLSTGGVGYFEHETVVDGDAQLEFQVRLDQVDDVLKSIVVYDDAGGVGTVSLPGREPLKQVFRDLPFGRQALSSPIALLNALQGAEIEAVGARALRGRLIRVAPEVMRLANGNATITRHRVSLMTAQGIQHLVFEEAESLRFADPTLRSQIQRALAAIETHRVRDKRSLRLTIKGKGKRTVRVAYVVETPLWKTSYRLTLPDSGKEDRALLHGWAIFENMSGQDWRNVELTLLSGNPVTFRQALYATYYVNRPTLPVAVLGRLLPHPDMGAIAGGRVAGDGRLEQEKRKARLDLRQRNRTAATRSLEMSAARSALSDQIAAAPEAPRMAAPVGTAVSQEAATQVIFRVPGTITVETGRSLMIPIVDQDVPIRRISLYQRATHARHPLAAVRLTNDTGSSLPPGVITLYQETKPSGEIAYVGDAQMTTLPIGEKRLVSFALDQKTLIDQEAKGRRTLATASINRGVFRRIFTEQRVTTYRIKSPTDEERTLLIEHPRIAGWKLASPSMDRVELTMGKYRIEVENGKDEHKSLDVVMERPKHETLSIASLSSSQIGVFAQAAEHSLALRQAFRRMAELRNEIERHRIELKKLEEELKRIFNDQSRIRGNLNRVPRGSDLHTRYLKKLNLQEDRLETLHDAITEARSREEKAEEAFANYVATLEI